MSGTAGKDTVKTTTVCLWATNKAYARATLDTGSRLNWMSEDVAERIGAQIKPLEDDDSKVFHLMGGTTLKAQGKVVATWYFNVAPNGAVDIILGAEFLFREKIFTYNEAILTLQDTDLTAEEKMQKYKNLEAQKARSLAAKIRRETAIKEEKESKSPKGEGSSGTGGVSAQKYSRD